MSDSDDTDVLLLIPPDFFFNETDGEEELEQDFHISNLKSTSSMTSNYNDLHFCPQSELESINARIAQIERNFSTGSDISTISNCTVRSKLECQGGDRNVNTLLRPLRSSPSKIIHSTPKGNTETVNARGNNEILEEIDTFLQKKTDSWIMSDDLRVPPPQSSDEHAAVKSHRMSLNFKKPNEVEPFIRLSDWAKRKPADKDPLISLSEIWAKEDREDILSLQEERLRRQHCEKTIQALQVKLLEYQQKIAVAIQVDKKKDSLLQAQQEENTYLKSNLQKINEDLQGIEMQKNEFASKLDAENVELKSRREYLEKELAQALSLATTFQDKNEILEIKLSNLEKTFEDNVELYKKQIDDLETRVSNSHKTEAYVNEEITKLKAELTKIKSNSAKNINENTQNKMQLELYQKEIELIKQQKTNLQEKFKDEKHRADILRADNKSLQDNLSQLKGKEADVLKELESQRISLKSYYQQQLEQVVTHKLKEFQTQLDKVEENLKSESKDRERLIAERAIKQLELVNAKNEQEITLLQEKHSEEVQLYRLQLSNASKKIDELEDKLNLYKSRRADIASKLHNIMESQWQKALEVLTSPSANLADNSIIIPHNISEDKLDGVEKTKRNPAENEQFETPNSGREHRNVRISTEDRLQSYIEMLLNKSPRDLENLDEIFGASKSNHEKNETNHRNGLSRRDSKPPWK